MLTFVRFGQFWLSYFQLENCDYPVSLTVGGKPFLKFTIFLKLIKYTRTLVP